ncbi:helix-turn-helix domain-containing protein [Candidatus Latescibacterota bacterium]
MVKTNNTTTDTLFDIHSLSDYLLMSTKWIYTRTSRKEIPHYKIGGALRFRKNEIDKWITEDMKIPIEK